MIVEELKYPEVTVSGRQTCRTSNGPLINVLDLGNLPFSCFLRKKETSLPLLPLQLSLNTESGLVQLRHTVGPDACTMNTGICLGSSNRWSWL